VTDDSTREPDPGEIQDADSGAGTEESPSYKAPLDPPAEPFLERRKRPRTYAESAFVRLVATAGVVGICVAIAAVMGTQSVSAWIIGLVVSLTSVILAAVLWSSRTL
jgi:protein-S-isoprenylcysteine O-methyltransferase Ste14